MQGPLWRIYYTDVQLFSSTEGSPADAPREGVLCIVGYGRDRQRYIMHSWDFYRWDDETFQWWGHDIHGVFDHFKQEKLITGIDPGLPSVIHTTEGDFDMVGFIELVKRKGLLYEGRMCSREEWSMAMKAAHHDPDFPIGGVE